MSATVILSHLCAFVVVLLGPVILCQLVRAAVHDRGYRVTWFEAAFAFAAVLMYSFPP